MKDDLVVDHVEEKVFHLLERDRFDQAEALICEALKTDPENPTLLYYLAVIYEQYEDYEEAETTLRQVLAKDPEDEDAAFLLASVYKESGQYQKAELLVIDLIRKNPRSAACYAFYAQIMLETLHVDKADKLATEAMRLDPDSVAAQTVSVLCNVIQSNKEDYRERLSGLVKKHPQARATAHMMLVVLIEEGKNAEALRIARELLRLNPSDESLVQVIQELRVATHPTMVPLWPLTKYGWHASAVLWLLAILSSRFSMKHLSATWSTAIVFGWLAYVVYSWVWPPILKRLLK